ncbi:SUKH-4 family immunity protein [Streptomyces sp. NPDC059943]|uniref:SUKH-4 family immunity protein n=1 Tax=Streptomyces sp. NPDC059943 TaxID=3347010 RepID=UPI00364FFD86
MVTYLELVQVFGERDVYRSPESMLDGGIVHAGTRAVMSVVGIPCNLGNVLVVSEAAVTRELVRMADHYSHEIPELPIDADDLYWLASVAGGDACLNGKTGEVFFVKGDYVPPFSRINSSLEDFVECMLVIEREAMSVEVPDDPDQVDDALRELIGRVGLLRNGQLTDSSIFWGQVIKFYLEELAG